MDDGLYWTPPGRATPTLFVPRVGLLGAVGDAFAVLVAPLVRALSLAGYAPLVVAVIDTDAGAPRLRHALAGVLDPARIVAVACGRDAEVGSGHRDTALLHAVATELLARFPDAAMLLFAVRGGTMPALDPALVHYTMVCTAALPDDAGDADLWVLPADATMVGAVWGGAPVIGVDAATGTGVGDLLALLRDAVLNAVPAPTTGTRHG